MIDVTDRSNVYVRLAAIKLFLRHDSLLNQYPCFEILMTHPQPRYTSD
jgi:hypothetical protein